MIGEADRDAGERHHDRQHHREHRTERDEQDDDRGEDADAFARQRRPFGLLDELAAEPYLRAGGVECFSARSIIWRPTESGTSCDFASSCAFASATVPDFEMPPGVVYGSLTLVTCGTARARR